MGGMRFWLYVNSSAYAMAKMLHKAPGAAGFVLTTVEAIGDITATEEASALATFGDKHNRRVQGGLLGDGQHAYSYLPFPVLLCSWNVSVSCYILLLINYHPSNHELLDAQCCMMTASHAPPVSSGLVICLPLKSVSLPPPCCC